MPASVAPTSSLPETERGYLLTNLEREIIIRIVQGCTDDELASHLDISEAEIGQCVVSIYSKLKVSDRLELIVYAFHIGLVTPPTD